MQITVLQAAGIAFLVSLSFTIMMLIFARKHNREMREFWHDVKNESDEWYNQQKP